MLADSMKRLRLHLGKLVHETIINLALLQQALLAIPSPENDLTTEVSKKIAHVPLSNRLTQRKHNCCTYTWIFNSMIMPEACFM
jgi:hypothetical protein